MKFILFVEGDTEAAIPPFLKRWLDDRLHIKVGIKLVKFEGWPQQWREMPKKAQKYLQGPDKEEIIAVISLMDLYGPQIFPENKTTVAERYEWAKQESEGRIASPKFRQFFAVHETEAWLLSQPDIFPVDIQKSFPAKVQQPEKVNFDEPPAKLLNKLYKLNNRSYRKVTDGLNLFQKLDPQIAYGQCPYLRQMLDEMLKLAKEAGL